MPIAYSYKRFSSDAQEGNDSIRRQTAAAQKFIEDHPEYDLTLDTTLSLTDAGVSAYTGKNLKTGALRQFVDAVRSGLIPEGSWLLLESLDRFSRQSVNLAANELLNLINDGVVVVTLHNETIFRREDYQGMDGLVNLLGAMIAMQGHYQEQVTKGKRVAEAWRAKYAKVTEGHIVTKTTPFWLEVNPQRTGFVVLDDKAEIVREIYKRRANGEGKASIAADLTNRGVPTSKGRGSTWHPSAVEKLLNSDTVIGVLENRHGERFQNYYPAVVSQEVYQAVKSLRQQATSKGHTPTHHPLTGLVKHMPCNATMRRINKGQTNTKKMGKSPVRLQCSSCGVWLPYPMASSAVSDALFNSQWVPAPIPEGKESIDLELSLDALMDAAEETFVRFKKSKNPADRQQWERLTEEVQAIKSQLKEVKGRNTMLLAEIEEQRLKTASSLLDAVRSVAKRIEINEDLTELSLTMLSGKIVSVPVNPLASFKD